MVAKKKENKGTLREVKERGRLERRKREEGRKNGRKRGEIRY
jgi:hypothetical protein